MCSSDGMKLLSRHYIIIIIIIIIYYYYCHFRLLPSSICDVATKVLTVRVFEKGFISRSDHA